MVARVLCALVFGLSLSWAQQPATPASSAPEQATTGASAPQTLRIGGMVVNSLTGQAIASAAVAIAPANAGTDSGISRSVITGSDGRFVFTGLARGKYSLMARARGYSLQYFEHHDYYATAVAVGPDLDTDHLVFRLEPDALLEGDITDDNNEPIQYAMVRLFRTSTENGQQKTRPVQQAQTDDLGHYRIGHLAPGTYYVSVSARPWYAQSSNPNRASGNPETDVLAAQDAAALDVTYPVTFYPGTTDSAAATPLQITPGERATADVTLHAVPSLHLRINTGSTENAVLGRMVFPQVQQRLFDGYVDSVFNAPVSWVGPGVMQISGLAPGHYIVEMPPSTGLNDKGGSGRAWYREIDLTGDAEINAAEGPSFANISGSIFLQGVPQVPGHVSIQLQNPDTGESFRTSLSSRGEFDFNSDSVRPGRYLVSLESNGWVLQKLAATGAKVAGRMLEVTGTGAIHLSGVAYRGAAQVNGTAMHDDQPFSGAMIVLVPQDPANNTPLFRRDQSDSDGTFTLRDVVPGQYTVIAIANGWDLEWANPGVLQQYLNKGERIQVAVNAKPDIKVQVQ